jgi:hypothetical protein
MPEQPNYSALSQGLKLYTDAMRRLVRERLIGKHPNDWWQAGVVRSLSRTQQEALKSEVSRNPDRNKIDFIDPNHVPQIVGKEFNGAFKGCFGDYNQTLAYLEQVRVARNQFAHPPSGDIAADDAIYYLRAAGEVLRMAKLPEAAEVETLRQGLIQAAPTAERAARGKPAPVSPAKEGELPFWWQRAAPHPAFQNPNAIDDALFAATLGAVHAGAAREEFQDPEIFLGQTFFTANLEQLVRDVASRLQGGPGAPVTELQTPFGGGKTHALLTIYHLAKDPAKAWSVATVHETFGGLRFPENTRVIAFDGNERGVEPSVKELGESTQTLWGEVAWQVDPDLFLSRIAQSDDSGNAPGNELYRPVLRAAAPAVILIDELVSYLVKLKFSNQNRAKNLYRQTLQFVQELLQEAGNAPGIVILLSLPQSQKEFGGLDPREIEMQLGILPELQTRADRVVSKRTPVEDSEIYTLMRRRLFKEVDQETARTVARLYRQTYEQQRALYDPAVLSDEYQEQMANAWPIHPELVDVLYKKWSTATDFPRTRTVLQLMASIVADQWVQQRAAYTIQSGHVDLERERVRSKIVTVPGAGHGYDAVVAADIIGGDAHADQIDEARGGIYQRFQVARGVATSLLMHSFGGRMQAGASKSDLYLSMAAPNLGIAYIDEVLATLEQSLWYVHRDGELLRFQTKPNVYRVIAQHATNLASEIVHERLREALAAAAGSADGFRVLVWAGSDNGIPDQPVPTIAVLEPRFRYAADGNGDGQHGRQPIDQLWERSGGGFRQWRNSLLLAVPDSDGWRVAEESMRQVLAYRAILADKRALPVSQELSAAERNDLASRARDREESLRTSITSAYRWVFAPGEHKLEVIDLGATAVAGESVAGRVVARLSDQNYGDVKIMTKVSAAYFNARLLPKLRWDGNEPYPLDMLRRRFSEWTFLPLLPHAAETLRQTIREGLGHRLWAIAIGDNASVSYQTLIEEPEALATVTDVFDGTASLVGGEFLDLIREQLQPGSTGDRLERSGADTPGQPEPGELRPLGMPVPATTVIPKPLRHQRVVLELPDVPVAKTGNLQPYLFKTLQEQDPGARVSVTIKVESGQGIDATILDDRILVSLEMLGLTARWRADGD